LVIVVSGGFQASQPGPLPKTDDDRLRATGRALRYAESSARPPTPRPGTPP